MNSAIVTWAGSLDPWWSFGIEVVLKSTFVLFVALGIHILLRNRWPLVCSAMWNAAMLALLLLPLAVVVGPDWSVLPSLSSPVEDYALLTTNSYPPATTKGVSGNPERAMSLSQDLRISETDESGTSTEYSTRKTDSRSWGQSLKLFVITLVGLGMLATLLRLLMALRAVHRLRLSALPVGDSHWLESFERWSNHLGIRRRVCLAQSADVHVPVVVGSLRPMVLLPASLVELTEAAKVEAIISHELAHVRRHDYEWQLLLRILQIAYCYQPLIWIADAVITACRERACDEFAIHAVGSVQEYTATLMLMAERLVSRNRLSLGFAVVRRPQLTRRLRTLSASPGNSHCRISRIAMSLVLVAGTLLGSGVACVGLAQEQTSVPEKTILETRHQVRGMGAGLVKVPPKPTVYEQNSFELEVIDQKDEPITNVEVLLYRVSTKDGTHEQLRTGVTNDLGKIKFSDIVAASKVAEFKKIPHSSPKRFVQRPGYLVTLRRDGLSTVRVYCSAFDLALGGARQKVRLHPAAILSGRITNSLGEPVEGALVTVGTWAGTLTIEGDNAVRTDSDGSYQFLDLVAFDAAASQAEFSKSLDLRLRASVATEKSSVRDEQLVDAANSQGVSNLVITHPDHAVTNVSGGNVPGSRDVQLMPAALIMGRVVHFDSRAPAKGIPIIAVSRQSPQDKALSGPSPLAGSIHSASTASDIEGRYRLANLPAGEYDVWAQPSSRNWQDAEWVSHGLSSIQAQPNQTTQVPDITIGPGGTIRGQLVGYSTGEPLRFDNTQLTVRPYLVQVDGLRLQYQMMQEVPVNADGTFEIRTIPGKVRGFVFVRLNQDSQQAENGSNQPDYQSPDYATRSGQVFEVVHGQTIDAEFRVLSAAEIGVLRTSSQKAYQLAAEKKWDEAIVAYSNILAEHPEDSSLRYGLARTRFSAGRFNEALGDFEALLKLNSRDPVPVVYLANILATSPVDDDRNGARAVKLATSAVSSIRIRSSPYGERELSWAMSVLAAAFAENGQFDKAVSAQREAIALAQPKKKEKLQEQLDLYLAKTPYRRVGSQ